MSCIKSFSTFLKQFSDTFGDVIKKLTAQKMLVTPGQEMEWVGAGRILSPLYSILIRVSAASVGTYSNQNLLPFKNILSDKKVN